MGGPQPPPPPPSCLCRSPEKRESIRSTQLPVAATAGTPGSSALTPRTDPASGEGLGHRRRSRALPLGLSPEPRSQQGGERGRVSNVLLMAGEKVSCFRSLAAGTTEQDAGQTWEGLAAEARRRAGETEAGGAKQRSPREYRRAGSEASMEGGERPPADPSSPHLSAAGQSAGGGRGCEERLTSEPGPGRQPRGDRAAVVAASRRRVWPGERWRAGTKTRPVISSWVSWLQSPGWEQEWETLRAMGARGERQGGASSHPAWGRSAWGTDRQVWAGWGSWGGRTDGEGGGEREGGERAPQVHLCPLPFCPHR